MQTKTAADSFLLRFFVLVREGEKDYLCGFEIKRKVL
jgi:hypothetical protein